MSGRFILASATMLGLLLGSGVASAASLVDVHAILRRASGAADRIQMEERKFSTLTEIAVVQSRAQDAAGALATAQQALGTPVAGKAEVAALSDLSALMAVQVEAGDRTGAAQTLGQILRLAVLSDKRETVLITVATAQAKGGDVKAALKTAGTLPVALARIGAIQAEAGDPLAARAILQQALTVAAGTPERPASATDLAFIAAAQFKAGDQSGAARTFAEAVRLAAGGPEPASSPLILVTRVRSVVEIATAQIWVGDRKGAVSTLAVALRLARAIPVDAPKAGHLTDIARALVEAGDSAGARRALREARVTADKISDRKEKSAFLLDIAEVQAETGDVKGGVQTLDDLWGSILKATTQELIAQGEAQIARIPEERARAEAKATLSELVAKLKTTTHHTSGLRLAFSGSSYQLSKLAAIQAKAGDRTEAAGTFQQAVQAVWIPFLGADRFSLRTVAVLQAETGDWEGAVAWAGNLLDPEMKAYSLLGAAKGMLKRLGITICDFPSTSIGC